MRQLWSQAAFALMLAVGIAAWRWGGRAERRAALLIGGFWAATLLAQRLLGRADPAGALAALDALAFAGLAGLAWTERRDWLIYAVLLQAVALGVHALRLLSPAMGGWTYLTALAVTSYLQLLLLAWGVWRARNDTVRHS